MHNMIFYNKPYLTGNEFALMQQAADYRHLSGNGYFTKQCEKFFSEKYGFKKCLLTTSCTDALEMCAILLNIQQGDEVIMPSFTFVSTANAFILRGAKIVLADSYETNPDINAHAIESLITPNTKAIVVVHYAGVACNMSVIMDIAAKYGLFVIEDAAQAIDAFFLHKDVKKPLGSMGHLAAFSFHESKNIQCGEGGMLVINDEQFNKRAEIIWEKGTNRAEYFRGEVDKYNWVDVGSSFLPSELTAAFLYAQLQQVAFIQNRRKQLWNMYFEQLKSLQDKDFIKLPHLPEYSQHNAHIFYIVCSNMQQRDDIISFLKRNGVQAMFHYPGLHSSPFYKKQNTGIGKLPFAEKFSDCLLRLPLHMDLKDEEVELICKLLHAFAQNNNDERK